jgi:cytochrome c-type biogenesis protein
MVAFAFWVFLAGLISFLSPCVLPLVPGYVSMLSGIGVEQLKEGQGSSGKLFASALAFVIGFSAVFITMGATASAVGAFLLRNKNLLGPIAGALIILFGLHLIGWLVKISIRVGLIVGIVLVATGLLLTLRTGTHLVFKPVQFYAAALIFLLGPWLTRWLNRDVHMRNVGGNRPGLLSGFLLGFAFALGWTPCIGPILTSVLAIAAIQKDVLKGVVLLTFYSAGLAIPFLLTAIGIGRFLKFYQRFRKHLHTVEVFSGVLLLAIGMLIFANGLTWLSARMSRFQPDNLAVFAKGRATAENMVSSLRAHGSAEALANEPNVTFKDLQGADVPLASLKGKVVLVNFWATWCEPCRSEIPVLIGLQDKYSSQGFTMLGASMDEDGKKAVDPFIQKTQFNVGGQPRTMDYPIVLGTDAITDQFGGLLGMPTSYLISRDGKIVKKYIGVVNENQVVKDVEGQLGAS